MANVNIAIGIGRAIVENKERAARSDLANASVDALVLPLLHPAGLAFGEIPAHGEGGLWKIQCLAILAALIRSVSLLTHCFSCSRAWARSFCIWWVIAERLSKWASGRIKSTSVTQTSRP